MSLLATGRERGGEKRVCLAVRDPAFLAVLGALLEEWEYTVVSRPDDRTLALVEEGCSVPEGAAVTIRLGHGGYRGRDLLGQPLEVESLWATLEPRFHKPPRSHIRLAVDLPVLVAARGRREATRISSLSDLGTRFRLARELAPEEPLGIDLDIAGESYHLEGKVIYVVPRGDAAGTGESEIGMLFVRPAEAIRARLRDYIILRYLEKAARRFPRDFFCRGLEHFEISDRVRRSLECALPPS